jgi:hypothetical protein
MLDTPTFDNLLGVDVGMVDRGKKVGDHMLYMISIELVMWRPTVAQATKMILDLAGGRVKKVNGDRCVQTI